MNEFLRRAKELEHQMQKDRRYLHQHAEAGKHLPGTTKYVMERLSSIGLSPREICDSGITALIEAAAPARPYFSELTWMRSHERDEQSSLSDSHGGGPQLRT